ncbi:hypothetical protein MNEG_2002, partial [Monoraphidium neglectum]
MSASHNGRSRDGAAASRTGALSREPSSARALSSAQQSFRGGAGAGMGVGGSSTSGAAAPGRWAPQRPSAT